MQKRIICFSCLLVALGIFLMIMPADAEAVTLGVLDFAVTGKEHKGIGKSIARAIETKLINSTSFKIIDTGDIAKLVYDSEDNTVSMMFYGYAGERLNEDYISKYMKHFFSNSNYDYILTGVVSINEMDSSFPIFGTEISKNTKTVTIKMVLVDVDLGESRKISKGKNKKYSYGICYKGFSLEQWSESDSWKVSEKLFEQLLDDIIEISPPLGTVMKTEGKNIYLDLGKEKGVKLGQRFSLFAEGEVFKHPKTGKILYTEENVLGEIQITEVGEGYSVGILTRGLQNDKIFSGVTQARMIVE